MRASLLHTRPRVSSHRSSVRVGPPPPREAEKSLVITLLIRIERHGEFRLSGGAAFSPAPRPARSPDRSDFKSSVFQQLLDRFCCFGFTSGVDSRLFSRQRRVISLTASRGRPQPWLTVSGKREALGSAGLGQKKNRKKWLPKGKKLTSSRLLSALQWRRFSGSVMAGSAFTAIPFPGFLLHREAVM